MNVDRELLKKIRRAFIDAKEPFLSAGKIAERVESPLDVVGFHLEILCDDRLVARSDGEPGVGFYVSQYGTTWREDAPLRLTAEGHRAKLDEVFVAVAV